MLSLKWVRMSVRSSAIASIGYCADDELLEIEFRSGAVYRYRDVPERTYRDLLRAESVGIFFNRFVKNGFAFTRTLP